MVSVSQRQAFMKKHDSPYWNICPKKTSLKMQSLPLIGILSLLLTTGHFCCAAPVDSLGIETEKDRIFVLHQVENQETLYALSKRYRTTVDAIIEHNKISGSSLPLGTVLRIPWDHGLTHRVKQGETLYAIARNYQVNVADIKSQNRLTSNEVKLGQELIILTNVSSNPPSELPSSSQIGEFHVVREKETLYSISKLYQLSIADLKSWNQLSDNSLKDGDTLWLTKIDVVEQASTPEYVPVQTTELVSGPEPNESAEISPVSVQKTSSDILPVKETGIAAVIDGNPDTQKYLALHPSAPIGTIMKVRNEMTNLSVFVRVVGKLPKIGANNNVLIRLSPAAQEALGALDTKFRVELSYVPNQ